ncbi:acetoacetate decarboxylase family protein [Nonomuraea jabiensis]|uniref:acetoacetate decarboxylase family protein n=1 Tax=Nonomuraea jabiensis TaxID=882448 RepID=UPI003D703D0C
MPAFAPLYGLGSETASLHWLTVEYRTRPDVLARVLSPPLCPTEEPIAAVWVAELVSASFHLPDGGVERRPLYMRAGVCVRCRREDEEGAYPLTFFIEGLNHGVLGRELAGLPKKQTPPQPVDPIPWWFGNHFTLKLIPSAEGRGYHVNRTVRVPFRTSGARGGCIGQGEVTLTPSTADPLHLVACEEVIEARFGELDLEVGFGTYLDQVDEIPTFGIPSRDRKLHRMIRLRPLRLLRHHHRQNLRPAARRRAVRPPRRPVRPPTDAVPDHPSYETIGVAAPLLVLLLRCAQGLSGRPSPWGWRVPFLVSIPLGVVGLFLRLCLEESQEFTEAAREKQPLRATLRHDYRSILLCAGQRWWRRWSACSPARTASRPTSGC